MGTRTGMHAAPPANDRMSRRIRAAEHEDAGRFDAAIVELRTLIRETEDPETWNQLAAALLNARHPHAALVAAQRALALQLNYAPALVNAGAAAFEIGRHADAERWLEEAVALDPNDPCAWFNLAGIRMTAGRTDDATIALTHAIATAAFGSPTEVGTIIEQSARSLAALHPLPRAATVPPALRALSAAAAAATTRRTRDAVRILRRIADDTSADTAAYAAAAKAMLPHLFAIAGCPDAPRDDSGSDNPPPDNVVSINAHRTLRV